MVKIFTLLQNLKMTAIPAVHIKGDESKNVESAGLNLLKYIVSIGHLWLVIFEEILQNISFYFTYTLTQILFHLLYNLFSPNASYANLIKTTSNLKICTHILGTEFLFHLIRNLK